ncbi:MAG TPA: hypothetical protein PLL65_01260 [Phycisphaerae bacterium]|nr:hypothetical protein [Phycisphaerae bacterium]
MMLWNEANGIRLYNQLLEAAEDSSKTALVQSVASAKPGLFAFSTLSIPPLLQAFEFDKRRLNDARCARVACGAERYRIATGQWPACLDDLVPAYLDAAPKDSFAPDVPRRVKRTHDRLIIYSVGPNGSDDGGEVQRGKQFANSPDTGFILLHPSVRNQPPQSP